MALPKIESPKYELKLPSSGKVIKYRPYLVKEERILLIAMESKDSKQILQATKDIVQSCTFDKVDPENIPLFELEYIFLKLRSKSVGETSTVVFKCEKDEHENEVVIDLDSIEVVFPPESKNKNINLTDTIGVTLKYPTLKEVSILEDSGSSNTDAMFSLIGACIDSVYDSDKVYKRDSFSPEELKDFLESFSSDQFSKLAQFFGNLPKVQKKIEYTCKKCGHKNSVTLEGLQSFFA